MRVPVLTVSNRANQRASGTTAHYFHCQPHISFEIGLSRKDSGLTKPSKARRILTIAKQRMFDRLGATVMAIAFWENRKNES